MGDGGKGDTPRPIQIDWEKFEKNWNEIFGFHGKDFCKEQRNKPVEQENKTDGSNDD